MATNEVQGGWVCVTCGVEHDDDSAPAGIAPAIDCPICADPRQYLPATGQEWTTLDALADGERAMRAELLEPGIYALITTPKVGIGHRPLLVQTEAGNLLWDPPGYIDDAAVELVRGLGGIAAIVASHPHMYGVQCAWSAAFDDVPVWIAEADEQWVQRRCDAMRTWTDPFEVLPGIRLAQLGGHFPGSAVAHVTGTDGDGVLLSSDTIFVVEGRTVTFLWSYPNRVPLPLAEAQRLAAAALEFDFDRMYGNFSHLDHGARAAVEDAIVLWTKISENFS